MLAMKGGLVRRASFYIREIVFGFEDSLVSTLGVVVGVAIGSQSQFMVLLTGTVLVVVEALAMASGSYLSSKSAQEVFEDRRKQDASRMLQWRISDEESLAELLRRKKFTKEQMNAVVDAFTRERKLWIREVQRHEYRMAPSISGSPIVSGLVMGGFYILGGLFTVVPFVLLPIDQAMVLALILTGIMLFSLGFIKAKVTNSHPLKSGLEMTIVSLSAALIGYLIGRAVSSYFGIDVY